jgi:amino acid adenylation domain-containing protein
MRSLLHHSVIRNAEAAPEGAAFRCRGNQLTHGQLHKRAAELANTLVGLGVSSMDRVGIYMGKSLEMPVALYGILMAGGAYVPIDPTAPRSRIEFILKDCGIKVLIADKPKLNELKTIAASGETPLRHVVGLDKNAIEGINTIPWEDVSRSSGNPPTVRVNEDDLAYIMYTSGSTGVPKGLMHTHRSGLAYARYSSDLYRVSAEDILGNHAPLHFDISTFEFLTGPYSGACSVLIPEEEIMFAASLPDLIEREGLTFWYSAPLALIQMLTRSDMSEFDLSSLRWVLFGGEPFPPKYLEELMELIPSARFCNVYGPAEVNQCTYHHLPTDYKDPGNPVPIGVIWDGALGIIVDADGDIITDTRAGELLIASPSMMQGYWNRPDLNMKAFYFEEPVPGFKRRYYRTGDLFKRDEHGILHFLGRKDRQIKIRGFRLELDEVEAVLCTHHSVEEAAVIITSDDQGDDKIIAAVAINPESNYDEQALNRHLKERLPSYGLPDSIEVHSSLPRTTGGKIDRQKIAARHESSPVPLQTSAP